jgi:uncharacterized damage-inducible protein DinB
MWFHDLIAHKGWADAELLSSDPQLRALLHHMLVANRFWLLSIVGEPFVADVETPVPESIDALIPIFRTTHDRERAWLATATDAGLSQTLVSKLIPGGRCTVSDAVLQVSLHSQGHRAQCAKMLRALGGTPPATDFILWLVDRPSSSWPM